MPTAMLIKDFKHLQLFRGPADDKADLIIRYEALNPTMCDGLFTTMTTL